MAVIGLGGRNALLVQSLVDLRGQLGDLHRQLSTGKKGGSYADLGPQRGYSVGLRSQLSAISSFNTAISTVSARINVAHTVLTQADKSFANVRNSTLNLNYAIDSGGQTIDQRNALGELTQVIAMLNTRAGERYAFSGAAGDRPAAEAPHIVLDGTGNRAGFRQVAAERRQADLGVGGLGRLAIPAVVGSTVSISEDVAGSPFGFKLAAVNSTLGGAAVTGPAGSPVAVSIDLSAATVVAGETIRFTLSLPDGTTEEITLTATSAAVPAEGEFVIGATTAATATNLRTALSSAVTKRADTALAAASAFAAANDFFAIDGANPPRRVAGPPFDTATALVSGTSANTVSWYIGESGTSPARTTATARVDASITVSYGIRGNEPAIRSSLASIAAFATMTFSTSDPNARDRFQALRERAGDRLDVAPGEQRISHIAADLAAAQVTMSSVKDRHATTVATLEEFLNEIEGVSNEEVGAKILALQTRLQASMQTTAILTGLSLVDYI